MRAFTLVVAGIIGIGAVSCGGSNEQAEQQTAAQLAVHEEKIAQIKDLEKQMHDAVEIDLNVANNAIQLYTDFVTAFPEDTLSPEYLFKAGEVATAAKKYKRALEFYQTITQKYPEYKHVMQSLYLEAFLYDNFLDDDTSAKKVYEEIITKYPNTNYAKDAQAAIENLGKSDEELIKEFEKKNEKK